MKRRAPRCSPSLAVAAVVAMALLALTASCTQPPRAEPPKSPPAVFGSDEPTPAAASTVSPASPAIEVIPSGPIVVRDLEGQRAWTGSADSVRWHGDTGVLELTGVRCAFFAEGREVLDATAPRARIEERSQRVTLSGGVRLRSRLEDAQVEADTAVWEVPTRRLVATGHITVVRGTVRLTGGERMEADAQLKDVRLTGALRFEGAVQR